ncbi:hypothetical protein [Hyalangium rubrum]|uniref:Uncharacterized protein n=1 Tax=Hyalangium rubrum TaxID=3103134 RepID=A0ABU5H7D2_9BACT|nr:hypothetical protein [Hyalangium sp. s54d21]MDY7227980.1 hypothetical protein [Hyalangium sp. s54d21]
MGVLRVIAVVGGVCILLIVVLTAGSTLMPGTKVRKLFGASPDALAGIEDSKKTRTLAQFQAREALAADAGTDAGTPAPVEAKASPEEQGR